jgi:acetyl/propionyl-CoA carboxylase alpha subunit
MSPRMEAFAERQARTAHIVDELAACITPPRTYLGCSDVFAALAQKDGRLVELASLPLGALGHRLVALRYFIANGETWMRHFAWDQALQRRGLQVRETIEALRERVKKSEERVAQTGDEVAATLDDRAAALEAALQPEGDLDLLVRLQRTPALRATWREQLNEQAASLADGERRAVDLVYLATYDLATLPATTVTGGEVGHIIVADKGEMGVRAVREVVALGAVPVVVFSKADDSNALQVRLAKKAGGFGVALEGSFRETYGDPEQIAARVKAAYRKQFGDEAAAKLSHSAVYPGYGPLAESTAAIRHFRSEGIVFVGPTQDTVELAGDKRTFRALAQRVDPKAVTPGITIEEQDAEAIVQAIVDGHERGAFKLPGRVKAANGGGGRGQVVVRELDAIPAAVRAVLGQIVANGWDPGVMFEQNIPETTHLEVQVVRDRFGNARHFGMRDCTEQRASQKIQEEAPPALLRNKPELSERCCQMAIDVANAVGYVGACTVELMYKDGAVYLLEMNTRIQVEHPVTEMAHRIRRDSGLEPLNLVQLQLRVASGRALDFAQEDVVPTHVAREFRINAESWKPSLKDSRDGGRGLFVPNAGVFDKLEVPAGDEVLKALTEAGEQRIAELDMRFDCGFEVRDVLVNKDPTFGKLIVAVKAAAAHKAERYELLRLASIEVLKQMRIQGRQVMPSGKVIKGSTFETNIPEHIRVLETELLREHGLGIAAGRHVNWVVAMLRKSAFDA